MNGTVYATDGFGFLCLPRNITQRLAEERYIFDEADAWLDLWCHTVSEEPGNAFSFIAPAVQYGNYGAILTMEKLGQRWGWEKTKVWRFFKKHGDVFALYRLPGSYGCLVFNKSYPMDTEVSLPEQAEFLRMQKSRLLMDRLNEALTVLRKKPDNGERLYNLIYTTYIAPEALNHQEVLYRLNLSLRNFYRYRQQAISVLSIRLWATAAPDMDFWLEMLTLLEGLK